MSDVQQADGISSQDDLPLTERLDLSLAEPSSSTAPADAVQGDSAANAEQEPLTGEQAQLQDQHDQQQQQQQQSRQDEQQQQVVAADNVPTVEQQETNGDAAAPAPTAAPVPTAATSDHNEPAATSSTAPAPTTPSKLSVAVDEPSNTLDAESLAALHRWLACVCVITFDLEMGPTMEYCYPPNYLSQAEITNGQSITPHSPPRHPARLHSVLSHSPYVRVLHFSVSYMCVSVCGLAFPDSHVAVMGDLNFCFRMRAEPQPHHSKQLSHSSPTDDPHSLPSSKPSRSTHRFLSQQSTLFGYTVFRQRKDATNPRGYFQKSVVWLSSLPFLSLFTRCVTLIGATYHEYGGSGVEAAMTNVRGWVSPHAGRRVRVGLLGEMLVDVLPLYAKNSPVHAGEKEGSLALLPTQKGAGGGAKQFTFPASGISASSAASSAQSTAAAATFSAALFSPTASTPSAASSSAPISLSSLFSSIHHSHSSWFHSLNLYTIFQSHLHNLWYLWELTLTGAPLLVLTRSPASSSSAVLALLSLISPIEYRGDYRPYFTIYSADFKHYSQLCDVDASSLPAVMLGVTNPFFLKCCEKWPNILIMGEEPNSSGSGSTSPPGSPTSPSSPPLSYASSPTASAATKLRMTHKLHKSLDSSAVDSSHLPAMLVSKGSPLLVPDETVLKRLILDTPSSPTAAASASINNTVSPTGAPSSTAEINNAILRRAFHDLTEAFLRPFLPYLIVAPAMQQAFASNEHWNPYATLPSLPRFSESELLNAAGNLSEAELRLFPMSGMKAGRRHKVADLYKRFMRSNHFVSWFGGMRDDAEAQVWQMVVTRVKRLSGNVGSGGEQMEGMLARAAGEEVVSWWKQAQLYLEKAVVSGVGGEGGSSVVDVQLVSGLLLHMAMMKRSGTEEQMVAMERLEKDKAHLIELFGQKSAAQKEKLGSGQKGRKSAGPDKSVSSNTSTIKS